MEIIFVVSFYAVCIAVLWFIREKNIPKDKTIQKDDYIHKTKNNNLYTKL
jgi:hypothetical protein